MHNKQTNKRIVISNQILSQYLNWFDSPDLDLDEP